MCVRDEGGVCGAAGGIAAVFEHHRNGGFWDDMWVLNGLYILRCVGRRGEFRRGLYVIGEIGYLRRGRGYTEHYNGYTKHYNCTSGRSHAQ